MIWILWFLGVLIFPAVEYFFGAIGLGSLLFAVSMYVFEKHRGNWYLFGLMVAIAIVLDIMCHFLLGGMLTSISLGLGLHMLLTVWLPLNNVIISNVVRFVSFFAMHLVIVQFSYGCSVDLSWALISYSVIYAILDIVWFALVGLVTSLLSNSRNNEILL